MESSSTETIQRLKKEVGMFGEEKPISHQPVYFIKVRLGHGKDFLAEALVVSVCFFELRLGCPILSFSFSD